MYELTSDVFLLPEEYPLHLEEFEFLSASMMPADHDGIKAAFTDLAERVYSCMKIDSRKEMKRWRMLAIENILVNLYVAASRKKTLTFPMGSTAYSAIHKMYGYRWYTRTFFKDIYRTLIEMNFIESKHGFRDDLRNIARITRVWVTEELLREFIAIRNYFVSLGGRCINIFNYWNGKKATITVEAEIYRREQPIVPVVLKDDKKHLIEYRPNRSVIQMRNRLAEYNEMIEETEILSRAEESALWELTSADTNTKVQTLGISEMLIAERCEMQMTGGLKKPEQDIEGLSRESPISHISSVITSTDSPNSIIYKKLAGKFYRVFNRSSFKAGGRFYGAEYQRLNSEMRNQMLINRNSVQELDFVSLHPQMLYNMLGVQLNEDPYDLFEGDLILRKAVKILFNIAVNAKSKISAILAFKNAISSKHVDSIKANKNELLRQRMLEKGLTPSILLGIIFQKHKQIKRFISSDMGVSLQYLDSNIADDILHHFTKQGIPVLCVHDSFIVQEQYTSELEGVMSEMYKKNMNGFYCKTDYKS